MIFRYFYGNGKVLTFALIRGYFLSFRPVYCFFLSFRFCDPSMLNKLYKVISVVFHQHTLHGILEYASFFSVFLCSFNLGDNTDPKNYDVPFSEGALVFLVRWNNKHELKNQMHYNQDK